MKDIGTLCLSFIIGMAITGFFVSLSPVSKTGKDSIKLLNDCQASLPRDQYCIITAVPFGE